MVEVIFTNYLNTNNRIYDKESCEDIIKEFKDRIGKIGVFYGELGHPEANDVSMKNISHKINDMWLDGSVLKAEVETLNTKSGKMLEENMDKMVFSSRSLGTVDPVTKKVKISKFITIDAIDWTEDSYLKMRLREKKLKRILNEN